MIPFQFAEFQLEFGELKGHRIDTDHAFQTVGLFKHNVCVMQLQHRPN